MGRGRVNSKARKGGAGGKGKQGGSPAPVHVPTTTPTRLSRKARHVARTRTRLHEPTKAKASGLGQVVARGHRVAPGKGPLWNPAVVVDRTALVLVGGTRTSTCGSSASSSAPCVHKEPPHVRVELERWHQVHGLRAWLKKACQAHGVAAPPVLAFERWLCRAKLLEADDWQRSESDRDSDTMARKRTGKGKGKGKGKRQHATAHVRQHDPFIPCIKAGEAGLVADLQRVLPTLQHAKDVAQGLTEAAHKAIEAIEAMQRAVSSTESNGSGNGNGNGNGSGSGSGSQAAPRQPWTVVVTTHKHSMDVQLRYSGGGGAKGNRKAGKRNRKANRAGATLLCVHKHLFKLNPAHWKKLFDLYCAAAAGSSRNEYAGGEAQPQPPPLPPCLRDDPRCVGVTLTAAAKAAACRFRHAVFCLLARYHALQGPGFQAAVVEQAFAQLHTSLGVTMECFASPLNCHFPTFCSAFPDTDAVFGSVGSFFDCMPTSGCYEVNPPFIDTLMARMVQHLHRLLALAATGQLHARQRAVLGDGESAAVEARGPRPLTFVVVVPGWKEDPAWQQLTRSRFLTASWLLARDDHGFCDGAQHQRRDRYRESPFDTSVFVLQTPVAAAAAAAAGVAGSNRRLLERSLREAFAQGVPTPAMVARRLRDGRGFADADGGGGVYAGPKRKKKPKKDANNVATTAAQPRHAKRRRTNGVKGKKRTQQHT